MNNRFLSFLMVPLCMLAACTSEDMSDTDTDSMEVQERSFSECPDLAGHWEGLAQSGDEIEAWIYKDTQNIKVATVFFTDGVLSNIASYDLYPDGGAKFETEGPTEKVESEMKTWCQDDQLWLIEYRSIESWGISLEMVGYFTREDPTTIKLTSVNNSLPSGNVVATLVP